VTDEGSTTTYEPKPDEPTTATTVTTKPVIPYDLVLFEFENFEELLENTTPLDNGWFALKLDGDWWEIFDENGVPFGVVHLPDGGDINEYDLEFIEENIIPLEITGLFKFVPEQEQEPQQEQPQEQEQEQPQEQEQEQPQEQEQEPEPEQPKTNPQTGDNIFIVLLLLALAASTAFIFRKSRKHLYNI